MLPVPAVELMRLERRDIDAIEATHVDIDLIGVGTRDIEWMNPARGAKRMLGRAGIEAIGRQRVGAGDQFELFRRHDEMQKALLGADRTIAFRDARKIACHTEPHATAMAAALVGF